MKNILKTYWGFSSFRPLQEDIINSILSDNDTLTLLPTGGGKSICFQVPAMLKDGICIVISPLIALIEDQVQGLQKKNIKVAQIKSGSSEDEIITLFDNIRFGKYKFLYLSPERLQSKFIQRKIAQLKVSMVAIDEAHCISEWGHDFRPSYRNIAVLREIHPNIKFIALTATATKEVMNDIIKSLQLQKPNIFKKSFFRKNLTYKIVYTEDKLQRLHQIYKKVKEPSIVYVNTRKRTQDIANYLNANNFPTSFYHGGMTINEKKTSFKNWHQEKTPIMVATNAFGMGIDKPNVRVVVHYNLPYSIENYVQEAGRGGRNGEQAFSIVLGSNSDIKTTLDLQKKTFPSIKEIKIIHKKLYQCFQIAMGEITDTQFDINLIEFCKKYEFNITKTFNALQILSSFGIIEFNPNVKQKSRIQFLVNSNKVLDYVYTNTQLKKFTQTLLRLYTGVFEDDVKIDEYYIAKKAGITSRAVIKHLESLAESNILEYYKNTINPSIFFLHPREDDKTINRFSKEISRYLNQKKQKTNDLIAFIQNRSVCRSVQILEYFDEKSIQKCGSCDICKKNHNSENIKKEVLNFIKTHKNSSSREICEQLTFKEEEILVLLRFLISEKQIGINNNTYYLYE